MNSTGSCGRSLSASEAICAARPFPTTLGCGREANPGYGWGVRGTPFHVASSSPELSVKTPFYGLYQPLPQLIG